MTDLYKALKKGQKIVKIQDIILGSMVLDWTKGLENLSSEVLARGLRIVIVLIAGYCLSRFLEVFTSKAIERRIYTRLNGDKKQRAQTLVSIFAGTLSFVIWVTAALMILSELGMNIAPILAGLGLMGLAIGMASKDILSDFIAGLFILLEDQYRVGDSIGVAGVEGIVREITLRRTILQGADGIIYSVPNSQIKVVVNQSR